MPEAFNETRNSIIRNTVNHHLQLVNEATDIMYGFDMTIDDKIKKFYDAIRIDEDVAGLIHLAGINPDDSEEVYKFLHNLNFNEGHARDTDTLMFLRELSQFVPSLSTILLLRELMKNRTL